MTSQDREDLVCANNLQRVEISDSAVITYSPKWCVQVVNKSIHQSKPCL
jgi:hypothetical protein